MQLSSVFLDVMKIANFWWKNADVSRTQRMSHTRDLYVFQILFRQVITVPGFIIVGYV